MKVGDLCVVEDIDGLCVFLGEGIYDGWYRIISLKTKQKAQTTGWRITKVKKNS